MTIQEAIAKLEAAHVKLPGGRTCDGVIYGDTAQPCTGIALTCCPSVSLIRAAAAQGCNLVICHEPTFYGGYDETQWLKNDPIYQGKKALLDESGVVIYRDHDRVHSESPDMIFSGVAKRLGWESYGQPSQHGPNMLPDYLYVIPETTVGELAEHVKTALQVDGFRYIGNPNARVTRVGLCAHFFGGDENSLQSIARNQFQVVIPLETVDWTIWSYVEDGIALGQNISLFNVGHFNVEEPGMEYMEGFLREALGDSCPPIRFIQSGNTYKWFE